MVNRDVEDVGGAEMDCQSGRAAANAQIPRRNPSSWQHVDLELQTGDGLDDDRARGPNALRTVMDDEEAIPRVSRGIAPKGTKRAAPVLDADVYEVASGGFDDDGAVVGEGAERDFAAKVRMGREVDAKIQNASAKKDKVL